MRPQFRFASIFSGCGGFDYGFQQEGFRHVAAFDNDEDAITTFRKNVSQSASIFDLTQSSPVSALRNLDVLLAGPPCQGFSLAGKREFDDPRNHLLIRAGQIAVEVKPRVFIVENVPGIKSGRHRNYWTQLIGILHAAQYRTRELYIDGITSGIPQTRRRIILVAWRTQRDFTANLPDTPGGVLEDAINQISPTTRNHEPLFIPKDSRMWKIANAIRPGQKLSNVRNGTRSVHSWDIPQVFGKVSSLERRMLNTMIKLRRQNRTRTNGDADPLSVATLRRNFPTPVKQILSDLISKGFLCKKGSYYDLAHTFNGTFRRLEWSKPSYTVDTRFGNPRYFLHPTENRGFTVREAARIQGFPDTFIFTGSKVSQYKQVGNAVPPPIAAAIANIIFNFLRHP